MRMQVLDAEADDALGEVMVLCDEMAGRGADLIRWLGRHPELAGVLAEHLADSEGVDEWMAPLRNGTPAAEERTLPYAEVAKDCTDSTTLAFGDFELLRELGRGGMGVVYKARHKGLNKIVALKTVMAAGFHSPRDVARLQFEAEAAARLDHPNIVPIYGAGAYQGMPFFSMKYIAGGTLAEGMESLRRDLPNGSAFLAKVARAVHFAHRCGIVHRDLKPGNILIENGEPMIADFGLAKTLDAPSGLSVSGAIVGTPAYMPPEQARGDKGSTTSADIYSLGAILYQLLTGQPPFRGDTIYETLRLVMDQVPVAPAILEPKTPPDLEAICLKCLEKNAENRYASAAELADDLEGFSRGESVSVRPRSVLSLIGRAVLGKRDDVGPTTESWMRFTARALVVIAVCHGVLFGLIVGGASLAWVWAVILASCAANGLARIRQIIRSRAFFPWERHMVVLWTGHLVCTLGLAAATLPFDPDSSAETALAWYPPLTVLYALAMFVQGSISRGWHYPAGFLYLGLAVALRFSGPAAPLIFLALHCPMQMLFVWLARRDRIVPTAPMVSSSKPV